MTTQAPQQHASPLVAISYRAKSDIGQRREENQDAFGVIEKENFKFYVVCDGMGGVKGGAVASSLAITTIDNYFKDKIDITDNDIVEAVSRANTAIFQQGANDPGLTGMGTTFVGIAFTGTDMFISSVGDSRAYRMRDGQVDQLTEDHTLVHELLRSGAIDEEQAGNHPVSHMLTRSLGPAPSTEVDCTKWSDAPRRGDRYLLCSDGLYNMLGPEEFSEIVQSLPPEEAVEELISLANLRGGVDNITVILVSVGDDYPSVAQSTAENNEDRDAQNERDANATDSDEESPVVSGAVDIKDKAKDVDTKGSSESGFEFVAASKDKSKIASEESSSTVATNSEKAGNTKDKAQFKFNPKSIFSDRSLVIAMAIGLPVALAFGYILGSFQERQEAQPLMQISKTIIEPEFQVAEVATHDVGQVLGDIVPKIREPLLSVQNYQKANAELLNGDKNSSDNVHYSEAERIERRRQELQVQITDIQEKINSFDSPISGHIGETLREATVRLDELARAVENVRAKIDIATRSLTVWYGRKKRLEGADPVNLAAEVAASSDLVKMKKESFEQATYSYLKEAEVLRYTPNDQTQHRKVRELARSRSESRRDLVDAIKQAIDDEVSTADKTIAEFTLKRERAEADMEQLRRTIEYVKILMGDDSKAKELKRKELERSLEVSRSELAELELIAPAPRSKEQSVSAN